MKVSLPIMMLPLLVSGCYPEQPDFIEELDLVYTNYSPSFDFSAQRTYALPDSVVRLTGNLAPGQAPQMVAALYGDRILQQLQDNMGQFGWTRIPASSGPDVILLPALNNNSTVNYYYDWSYWDGYYPGYSPGWGWYYPGYYMPVVETYNSGTLVVAMTHPNGIGDLGQVPVVWTLVLDGLLEGSTLGLLERIDRNIAQGFTQSSYLQLP